MLCPTCNRQNSKIYNSRFKNGVIWRRRECLSCGERWTTYEIDEGTFEDLSFLIETANELKQTMDRVNHAIIKTYDNLCAKIGGSHEIR